jgi:hypothetical protein
MSRRDRAADRYIDVGFAVGGKMLTVEEGLRLIYSIDELAETKQDFEMRSIAIGYIEYCAGRANSVNE